MKERHVNPSADENTYRIARGIAADPNAPTGCCSTPVAGVVTQQQQDSPKMQFEGVGRASGSTATSSSSSEESDRQPAGKLVLNSALNKFRARLNPT